MKWAGQVRAWIPQAPACLPVRFFFLCLLAATYLPVWVGSADPWWRVKEWAALVVGCSWLATRSFLPHHPLREGRDKWLAILAFGIVLHFSVRFILPILQAPAKLFQQPWPWLAFLHAMVGLVWLTDIRRLIREVDVQFIVKAMAWLGVGLSAYMTFQAVGFDPLILWVKSRYSGFLWLHGNHVIGLMGNPFQAAAVLAALVPAVAFQAFHPSRRGIWQDSREIQARFNFLWLAGLVFCFAACWLAQSTVSLLAAVLGAVLASGKIKTRKSWLILAGLGLILGLILVRFQPNLFLSHGRPEIWNQALSHIRQHPILGVGLNQFKTLGIVFVPDNAYKVWWAHNEWVHFATELGLIWTTGLAVYIGREAIRLSRVHVGLFGCFAACLILSLLHIPWHLAPTLAVTGICLASAHLGKEHRVES